MNNNDNLARLEILITQRRYAETELLLKDLLTQESDNIYYLSMFAEVNLQQDKPEIAREVIDNAIGLSPDSAHLFYIKSRIELAEDKYDEAEKCIIQSIALDPYDADYFALLANIKLTRKQFQEALKYADKALEIDPTNLVGLNTRSSALVKMDKKEAAFETIEGALREDPTNPYTHTNYGWGLLEKGNHKKALEHFREALKNDPNFEPAQSGMMEALKASNVFYRWFLKYSFFMSNLTRRYQWGVLLGYYFGVRLLRVIANSSETLQPFLIPLIIVLSLVAFSTWVITPISNMFLRFNKYGEHLLSSNEKMSSNFVAGSFALCLAGLVLYFVFDDSLMLMIAAFGFAMMVPFGSMFNPAKYPNALLIYTMVMAFAGLSAIAFAFISGDIFNLMTTIFIIGFIAFQWIANYVAIERDNK